MCAVAPSSRASSAALFATCLPRSDGSTPTTMGAAVDRPSTLARPGDEVHSAIAAEAAPKLAQGQSGQPRRHRRARRRRSPDAEHRTQLAEVLARPVADEDLLASVRPLANELDQPLLDDVDEVGLVALLEERLA